ncbi:alpha/beta fold hydrolase [Alkalihalobacterium alkalinitrilicum]|uniref:alpha/beta fold hydrolase n=1 Tax=Alkalihalobacterium alkalinitrilicum TaxID=427920 RepID=UPI000994D4CF|nr:alpha/beta hydrolase [Alkalihalobacterium alkalinitrilicum]
MIAFADFGKGEPIVFIHGLGQFGKGWDGQHELANDFRLVIPDLRGHGYTKMKSNISLRTFASDIIDLLDILNIEKAHICGLSLGGIVSQEIYRLYPERVKSLVICNSISYFPYWIGMYELRRREHMVDSVSEEEYKNGAVQRCIFQNNKELQDITRHTFILRPEEYKRSVRAVIGMNYLTMLPLVKVPTLIFGSVQDRVTPYINQVMQHQLIRHSKLVTFNQTGHASNIERKEEFNLELVRFLERMNV